MKTEVVENQRLPFYSVQDKDIILFLGVLAILEAVI